VESLGVYFQLGRLMALMRWRERYNTRPQVARQSCK
jgi:hypothetical protein